MSKINVEHIKVLDIGLMTNTEVTVSGDSMILTPLPSDESDYERGMRESMQKIAKSCGKVFAVDIDYEQLPVLVDSLVNPQPKRTRTEYEKVTESIFDLRDEFERGELYWWYESDCKDKSEFVGIRSEYDLSTYFAKGNIYRKVEKEIDERQEFVERAISEIESCNAHEPSYYGGWFEQLYEAGCRFQD